MKNTLVELYAEARRAHAAVLLKLHEVKTEFAGSGDMAELADAVYALKETEKLAEDVEKETRKLRELAEKLCCAAWLSSDGDVIRTNYVSATPEVKQTMETPKPGTEGYAALCAHFGVNPDSPYRPHWPSMLEVVSADLAAGRPAPPGLNPEKTWTVFRVATRKKKAIDVPGGVRLSSPVLLREMYALFVEHLPEEWVRLERMQESEDAEDVTETADVPF